MPASLVSLKIRGIRSYAPTDEKLQTLEFLPLTLIVGSNGSGKTSIIESLRFIIAGEEPPLSDSRRNFINSGDGTSLSKKSSHALIELEFSNSTGEICRAKREISQIGKASTPSISSAYKIGGSGWKNVHRQEDWNKTIPQLFNLPNQALLNNVVLCHQENNDWCMDDSSTVKQIFDKIFGCEQYKREIKHIDAEIKSCNADLQVGEKALQRTMERVQRKRTLKSDVIEAEKEMKVIDSTVAEQEKDIKALAEQKSLLTKDLVSIEAKIRELKTFKQKIEELTVREKSLRGFLKKPLIDLKVMPYEELKCKLEHHIKLVHKTKQEQAQSITLQNSLKNKLNQLERNKKELESIITKLKIIDLKSRDTSSTLQRTLKTLNDENSSLDLDCNDIPNCLKVLEDVENKMKNDKSDQADLEDSLADKQQELAKTINNLESKYQNVFHKIRNKEVFIKKLTDQLAQADPIAMELCKVINNLARMSEVIRTMLHCTQVETLKELIEDSKDIINLLIDKVNNETVVNVTKDIEKEKTEVEVNRILMRKIEEEKLKVKEEQTEVENKHSKARSACKEAHNQLVVFSNEKKNIVRMYTTYSSERKFIESKNMNEKVEELKKVSDDYDSTQNLLSDSSQDYKRLSDDLSDSFEKHEEYKNNIQIYDILKQVDELKCRAVNLEETIEGDSQLERLQLKLKQVETEELELRDKRSTLNGTKLQLQRETQRLNMELKAHSNAFKEHSISLGQVACNKIIMKDLDKLKECLQSSVLSFHNQMIIKINEVLRARWRQIYQGKDIDHIELVDEEITRGKDKKTFNYYIAMRKAGIRMKMREKSSAGQRALASIVLRMTLAELFVKDFAFIALDEPTANLDSANVLSLAKAIGIYVKRRSRKGMNIQWIIITHDETFLKALDAECSPFFYKVHLDSEGHSKVVRVSYQEAALYSDASASSTQKAGVTG